MRPPAPTNLPREVSPQGMMISDYFIPGGVPKFILSLLNWLDHCEYRHLCDLA